MFVPAPPYALAPGRRSRRFSRLYRAIELLFVPPVIPTVVPRAIVLSLLAVVAVLLLAALRAFFHERSRRRLRGAFWWRLLGAPLESIEPAASFVETLWALVRGAASGPRPDAAEIGRLLQQLDAASVDDRKAAGQRLQDDYTASTLAVTEALKQLATELNNQYVVTYVRPEMLIPPQKIEVAVTQPGLTVRAPKRLSGR